MDSSFVSYVSPDAAKIVPSPAMEAMIESARRAQRAEQRRIEQERQQRFREIESWPVVGEGFADGVE